MSVVVWEPFRAELAETACLSPAAVVPAWPPYWWRRGVDLRFSIMRAEGTAPVHPPHGKRPRGLIRPGGASSSAQRAVAHLTGRAEGQSAPIQ